MPTFKVAKLVRDYLVDQQITTGAKPSYRQLSAEEHKAALIRKLAEEVDEISRADPDEIVAEIADLQQVIDDLCRLHHITAAQVAAAQAAKNRQAGPFQKGLYIESVSLEDDNHWVGYYRKNADRYPEVAP